MTHHPGEGECRPRSWARLDLQALRENLARARDLAPSGRLLVVMKADAYGHGAVHLAPVVESAGAAMIGVGDSSEALELRAAGIAAPLLVLGDLVPSEIPDVVREDIIPVVHSGGRLAQLEEEAARQGRRVRIHLKVDTGMGRLGMLPSRLPAIARMARESDHLEVDGLMTHLAGHGPGGRKSNGDQVRLFAELLGELQRMGMRPPNVHFRNSTALLEGERLKIEGETLSRTGALIYGFSPGDDHRPPEGYRPVLSLHTQLVFLKDLPAGAPVGYDGIFTTRRPTRLGVIPFGYHDGMWRTLANKGSVIVRGRRVPVIGKVSMDYATIDITHVAGASVGDLVTIIGRDRDALITVEELAAMAGTSPYDFLCSLGRRVVRVPDASGVVSA